MITCLLGVVIGIWIAPLTARYRDTRYMLPFLIQIGFFLTPVIYETQSLIPPQWQAVFSINPMVGLIESFRAVILGDDLSAMFLLLTPSLAFIAVALFLGLFWFRFMERSLVDRI